MINLFMEGSRTVVLVSRDEKGKRTIKKVDNFFPYMYVEDPDGEYKGLFNERLKRVVFNSPIEVKQRRDKYPKTWESDILFLDRFLIDRVSQIPKTPIRKLYFDIETEGKSDIDTKNTPDAITCICISDSFSKKKAVFVWHPLIKEKEIHQLLGISIFKYGTEQKMLSHFIDFINSIDPDLLIGWNSNNFDIPYLINRCKKIGLDFGKISMNNRIKIRPFRTYYGWEETEVDISGRYAFDLLRAYRYTQFRVLDSYSLNYVAREELKDEKIPHKESFTDLWNNDINKLIKYCLKDVELVKRLDEKLEIVATFNERRLAIGCRWGTLWQTTRFEDILFLRAAKAKGICLPRTIKKRYKDLEEKSISGGFVRESEPGLHYGVVVLDLKSLYPSIMRTFNMSPETVGEWNKEKVFGKPLYEPDVISIEELNLVFLKHPIGLVSSVITKLWALRDLYKRKMKEAKDKGDMLQYRLLNQKQYTMKVAMNQIFGALDYANFRLHNKRISGAITHLGQRIIKWSAEITEKAGYNVIYGDTDSIFIELGDLPNEQLEEKGKEIANLINNSFDEFIKPFNLDKHFLLMQFEKVLNPVFFGTKTGGKGAKKRYAGYIQEGGKRSMLIKGFEVRRSDSAPIAKQMQQKIFEIILNKGKKDDIMKYVNEMKKGMKEGKFSYDEIAIPKGIKKKLEDYKNKTSHVRGVIYSRDKLDIKFGMKIKAKLLYVSAMPEGYAPTDVVCFEHIDQIPKGIQINWKRQMPVLIDNKLERTLEALGMSTDTKNKTLEGF